MMFINKIFIISILFLLVGCRTVNTTSNQEQVITSPMLARYVHVESINSSDLDDGSMKVQFTISNKTRFSRRFLYKVDWYDANGFLMQGPTNIYIPSQVNGKETIFLTSISPKPNPSSYKINFIKSQ